MSMSLLVWKWSPDYDTPAKRRRHKLKFPDVTNGFIEDGTHPAIGEADISPYIEKILEQFQPESSDIAVEIEECTNCVVLSYANIDRIEVVTILGRLAMSMGLNASEL